MTERVHEKEIQQINQENRANLNQWEMHGVCPDDEDEIPICSYCDKEYGSDFCKGCPEYDGEDAY